MFIGMKAYTEPAIIHTFEMAPRFIPSDESGNPAAKDEGISEEIAPQLAPLQELDLVLIAEIKALMEEERCIIRPS